MNKLKEINKSWDLKIEMIRSAGKPCHILKYCPYGSLVEDFELSESEKSCKLFGHDCPMYTYAEPLRESLSAGYERKKMSLFHIGKVRRFLMVNGTHKWNSMVRDFTAQLEMRFSWLISGSRKSIVA